ncbi:MAG: hypothetical protein MJ198_00650 [Bacteroidales bacterium]|nr:hypothetical protein [Bacteroidales bacterium]
MNLRCRIIAILLFFCMKGFSQVPGTWNEYFSYRNVMQMEVVDDNIFALTENGLYIYNVTSKEIQKVTKIQGLSTVGLSCMAFCDSTSSLLIGYSDGMLDILLYPSLKVVSVPTIANKNLYGSKKINKIIMQGDTAFIAAEFGVLTFSMSSRNFISTTILSDDGSYVSAKSITICGDSVFAATAKGVYSTLAANSNMSDFAAWRKSKGILYENDTINFVASLNGTVYYAHKKTSSEEDEVIYKIENGKSSVFKTLKNPLKNLHECKKGLIVVTSYSAGLYDEKEKLTFLVDTSKDNYQRDFKDMVVVDSEPYVADGKMGMFNKDYVTICPKGPQSNAISDMQYRDSRLCTTSGKIVNWEGAMFDYMDYLGNWYSHKTWDVQNARCVYVQKKSDKFWYGSFGGLVSSYFSTWWDVDVIYNHENSCLQTYKYYAAPVDLVSDIGEDSKKNLWILNSYSSSPLIAITPDNKWYSYPIEILGTMAFEKLLVDSRGIKWLAGETKLVAYYENNTLEDKSDDRMVQIPLVDNEGTIARRTTCLAEDFDHTIWIGTNQGIAVHSSPSRVFKDRQTISRIKIEVDGEVGYLLHSELITCISVDGANRKWIGTEKSGVFLISENGTEQLLNFTKENSPLPSNTITAIEINHETGEIFIATDEGLVSYIADVTVGNASMNNVYVFPNPVRETYEGDIFIKGVVSDAIIKITDVSGNLVCTIESNGGTAVWNGRNHYGDRVKTGVYLAYISDESGKFTKVTKILFVN